MQDLSSLKLSELKDLAKEKGLKNISTLKKQELIEKLSSLLVSEPARKKAEPEKEIQKPVEEVKKEAEKPQERTADLAGNSGQSYNNGSNGRNGATRVVVNRQGFNGNRNQGVQSTNRPNQTGYNQNRSYGGQTRSFGNGNSGQTRSFGPGPLRNQYNRNQAQTDQIKTEQPVRNEMKAADRNESRSEARSDNFRQDNPRQEYQRNEYQKNEYQKTEYQRSEPQRTDYGKSDEYADSSLMSNGRSNHKVLSEEEYQQLDSGEVANGILEVVSEGFGFIRRDNFLSGEHDVYISQSQIRRFNIRTGDRIEGPIRVSQNYEKFPALLQISKINGESPENAVVRPRFETLTPIFPNERLHLETEGCSNAMRIMDLFSPVGKGQRGMIVSPPKAGKTTLLKEVASAVIDNHPEVHIIILLIDERPEEVTDIKETIQKKSKNVEVVYSTFDELPEHHKQVSEMVLEHAKRLVEHGNDVMILLDSITRLTRAYNQTVVPSGRTLSGGLDPAALHAPKRFFGAARNMREGGSLTVLATALVDTGSRMDDVVFEEFKGTGNMEIVLDRRMSERRIFPAMDIFKSGTRRDDLLLSKAEQDGLYHIRKYMSSLRPEEAVERLLTSVNETHSNKELIEKCRIFKGLPNLGLK